MEPSLTIRHPGGATLQAGPGTSFCVLDFNPFRRTVRADQQRARGFGHGAVSGAEWQDEPVVTYSLGIRAEQFCPAAERLDQWMDLRNAIAATHRGIGARDAEAVLEFTVGTRTYQMFGRPRTNQPDTDATWWSASSPVECAFVALDPLIYDADVDEPVTLGLPDFEGGLAIPFTVPFTVPGVAIQGDASLVNDGDAEVGMRLRVDGPADTPRVSLLRPDGQVQTLTLLFSLTASQWVDIDTAAKTVLLQGFDAASRRGLVVGTWPMLPPGTSTLRFRAAEFNPDALLTASPPFSAWW